jgi:hypothetical protein
MKDIRQQWKALAEKREIKSEDIAALCIYRALVKNEGKEGAIARLRKSFNPVTNPVKIENGAAPYFALSTALWSVKYSTLLTWLDEEGKTAVVALSKEIKIKDKEIL